MSVYDLRSKVRLIKRGFTVPLLKYLESVYTENSNTAIVCC